MSPFRPDLVDCWVFRVGRPPAASEHRGPAPPRAAGPILPGLWQCVSGSLEADDRVAIGALRELREETGFGPADIEAFYDLDLVNQFHEPSYRRDRDRRGVRGPGRGPTPSPAVARARRGALAGRSRRPIGEVIWPGYRTAIERIRDDLSEPERAALVRADARGRTGDHGRRSDALAGPDLGSRDDRPGPQPVGDRTSR